MSKTIYDEATGTEMVIHDQPIDRRDQQITNLKAALLDAMQTLGWGKKYWFDAMEDK